MTDDTMALLEQIQKSSDGDFLRTIAEHTLHRLMNFEVEALIGAARHERRDTRTTDRNGSRPRQLDTRLGTLALKIPKLRQGSCFPAFLEPRKTAEKALTAVIQEAWIQGVSTRKVDDLVQALGMTGISKPQVSALCQEIDTRVHSFLERPLEGDWPYLWLDATYLKVRQDGRIISIAAIIATGVNQDRRREILGLGLGLSEAATFWIEFRRSLLCHVPKGQQTVVSVAEHDVLADMDFPEAHRTKLHSTNPIERLNKEVKRRTDVVGIVPNEDSVRRLVGDGLMEQNDDWQLQHRYLTLETMAGVAFIEEPAITILPPAKAA